MAAIKKIISDYFRTHCKRQLFFNICRDALPAEIATAIKQNFDDNQIIQTLLESGRDWEAKKFGELSECFNENLMGRKAVIDDRRQGDNNRDVFEKLDTYLKDRFPRFPSGTFIFEPEFSLPEDFIDRMGLREHSNFTAGYVCRPDIVELLPDRLPDSHEMKFRRYLTPEGRVVPMHEEDDRQRVRVIDIKLLGQASPSYFAEVTLYSMILASWFRELGLDSEYVVVPNAAIWPGSYNESELKRAYDEQKNESEPNSLWLAMQDDLEEAPIEAFIGAIRQFFREIVPDVLRMTPEQCDTQAYITHRCQGCIFLEDLGPQASHLHHGWSFHNCRDLAEQTGHLSLVPMMSEGTITLFRDEFGVAQTQHLGQLPSEELLQTDCKYLKANGRVAIERAKAIELARTTAQPPVARLLENTGTTCEMPQSPGVHVYLNTSYDFVHLITFSLAMRVVDASGRTRDYVRTIDKRDIKLEAEQFQRFCEEMVSVLEENAKSSIQFYFWDEKQYEHFQRLVERHADRLEKNPKLLRIAFLTPPEMVLPNPAMETWQSPRTIVSEVVNPRLVAPIPYHYSLLNTARCFHDPSKNESDFTMPELANETFGGSLSFEEPLNSQMPSEVIYEVWDMASQNDDAIANLLQTIHTAIKIQLDALETITRRLESDLGPLLFSKPPQAQSIQPPPPIPIALDSEIWLRFSQLDANADDLKAKQIHSLSLVEKESQCESARIVSFVKNDERREILESLNIPHQNPQLPIVCRLSEDSLNVKFKENDFGCCLAPLDDAAFLSSRRDKYGFEQRFENQTMANLTAVDILAVDRNRKILVIAPNTSDRYVNTWDAIQKLFGKNGRPRIFDLKKGVVIEKTSIDIFTRRLQRLLTSIGNPPEAVAHSMSRKLGHSNPLGTSQRPLTSSTPASEMIWNAEKMSKTTVERNLETVFEFLTANQISLNDSQHNAVEQALSKRLSLLWGPPGTGKSKTLLAIALGAIHEAIFRKRSLRILVTGPTYTAIDNVLVDIFENLEKCFPNEPMIRCGRIYSRSKRDDLKIPQFEADKIPQDFRSALHNRKGIVILGSTPQQCVKLASEGLRGHDPIPCTELFDLILLDEASQVEVSQAFLVYATLAKNASVVIAGDPLQMPPIRQAGIPKGLEPMLGSVYDYYSHEKTWNIRPCELLVNYRSNSAIVQLAREANYPPGLESAQPNLTIHLQGQAENSWLTRLVDPAIAVSAFVYKDGKSNQLNPFEAFCIEKIVLHLRENLLQTLHAGETPTSTLHDDESFWTCGIGIVTPHRAQQALVVRRLQDLFCNTIESQENESQEKRHSRAGGNPDTSKLKTLIRDAVDTVERFQGQQRDVILISFGMGDRDAIKKEEEFLMSLNRFNVMTSRARAKLIVFLSEELAHYVPDDAEVQKQSRFLKAFTDVFCNGKESLSIPNKTDENSANVEGTLLFYDETPPAKATEEKPVLPKFGTIHFNRDDETDFARFLDDAFFDAKEIFVTDKFIHHKRHFFSLMEFVKTLYRKKPNGEIALHVSTTRCHASNYKTGADDPQRKQEYLKDRAEKAARSAGIHLDITFKTEEETFDDHARVITTDHGWTILLDRGFDMFVFPPDDGLWISDRILFDMDAETKTLKTQKSYVVLEPPT